MSNAHFLCSFHSLSLLFSHIPLLLLVFTKVLFYTDPQFFTICYKFRVNLVSREITLDSEENSDDPAFHQYLNAPCTDESVRLPEA